MAARAKETQDAAHHMGVAVQDRGAKDSQELENVFTVISKERPDGLLTMLDPFTTFHLKHIVEFAANHQLPGMMKKGVLYKRAG